LQTLASYSVGWSRNVRRESQLTRIRDDLANAIGPEMIDWLHHRPTYWVSGNVAVIHAGASPHRSLDAQEKKCLLWGHPDFFKVPRSDGIWCVHGHTIVDVPKASDGRVAVDTGAYATGVLTAAFVEPESVTFLSTGR
jgi:serine/threonine protein phosphatase 1